MSAFGGKADIARTSPLAGYLVQRVHWQHQELARCAIRAYSAAERSNFSPGNHLARRISLLRACASMPSKREMRAATVAIFRFASRVTRCHVTVFRNFPTESPPV